MERTTRERIRSERMSIGCAAWLSIAAVDHPRELGLVRWSRDLDSALLEARTRERPVFLLFQEVPG